MNCSNKISSDCTNSEITLEEIIPVQISEKAANKINEKFDQYSQKKGKKPLGIRINVVRDGCSGMSYGMEYVLESNEDSYIETNGIKIFMDDIALKMLSGAIIDYHETESASGFVFNNPNERCKCACGKSFSA